MSTFLELPFSDPQFGQRPSHLMRSSSYSQPRVSSTLSGRRPRGSASPPGSSTPWASVRSLSIPEASLPPPLPFSKPSLRLRAPHGGSGLTPSSHRIMSDDEKHDYDYLPPGTANSTNVSRSEVGLKMGEDRADVVRGLVDKLTEACCSEERMIRDLEWMLSNEQSRTRQLVKSIGELNRSLETRQRNLTDLTETTLPAMRRKLTTATLQSESVEKKLPQSTAEMENASKEYKRGRQKAMALGNYLQWRTTRWYIRAHRYLRGERPFDWTAKSSHRRQTIIVALIWTSGVLLLIITVLIALYLFL